MADIKVYANYGVLGEKQIIYTAYVPVQATYSEQITVHVPEGYTVSEGPSGSLLVNGEALEALLGTFCNEPCLTFGTFTLPLSFECETSEEGNFAKASYWWNFFRDSYSSGKYNATAVRKMHELGCYKYDDEVDQMKRDIDAGLLIERIRKHYQKGKIDERLISQLHGLGCRKYDSEIEEYKKELEAINAEKVERMGKYRETMQKMQAKVVRKPLTSLALPAYAGASGVPEKGDVLMYKGVPYRVLTACYHDSEGLSFGAGSDEWYDVDVQDISETVEGKEMLAKEQCKEQVSDFKAKYSKASCELEKSILEFGERYTGKEIGVNDIPGKTILNTFDIYGRGIMVRYTNDTIWLIINNGSDSDTWSINNIYTGGAGAYAFHAPLAHVKDKLQAYLDVQKEYSLLMED